MHRKKRGKIFVLLILILVGLCGATWFIYQRYAPNTERVAMTDVLPGKSLGTGETYIFRNEKYLDEMRGLKKDGEYYLPLNVASEIDPKYYYQASSKELLFTDSKGTLKLTANQKEAFVDGEKKTFDYMPFINVNETDYISTGFIRENSNVRIETFSNPDRIVVFDKIGAATATIEAGEPIRTLTGIKSPVLRETAEESVFTFGEIDEWTKIVTADGYIGYVRTSKVGEASTFTGQPDYDGGYSYFSEEKPVVLGWHQVTNEEANKTVNDLYAVKNGTINVISPTWMSLKDSAGGVNSLCDEEYVKTVHEKGMKVWILVDDFSKDVKLGDVLGDEKNRRTLIYNLVRNTKDCGADGINIDFEQVTPENAPAYLQFLRELYIVSRKEKLTLSADNYVPQEYNEHYRRNAQAEVLDYFIIMGYDEHAGDSNEAGSVASFEFVQLGIQRTVAQVPPEKVINAIPFYTRLWQERPWTPQDGADGSVASENHTKVTNTNLGMNQQQEVMEKTPGEVKWNDGTKQNYYQAQHGGETFKMWLEDADSIEAKMSLIKDHKLAGVAAWKLGLETEDVWPVIKKYME